MNNMRKDKEEAVSLRETGKSYRMISSILKVPKSTLSEWFKDADWSIKIKKELNEKALLKSRVRLAGLNKTRGINLTEAYEQAKREAAEELKLLRHHPLFIAGLMLYWGEGDKVTKNTVRLTNTDPELIRLFIFFLEEICKIPREDVRISLLIYPDLDEKECRNYWAGTLSRGPENFTKNILIQGRHKTRRLKYGVCIVAVSSAYLKVKIIEWLRILPFDLMSDEYYASI
jgi:hypothetical protein